MEQVFGILAADFFEERTGFQSSGLHSTEFDECATTDATSDVVVDDEVHPDFIRSILDWNASCFGSGQFDRDKNCVAS